MSTRTKPDVLYRDDFMTGLLAAIAVKGIRSIEAPCNAVEEAVVAAFKEIEKRAEAKGIEVLFHLRNSRNYGGCSEAYGMLNRARRDRLFATDDFWTVMYLEIEQYFAPRYFENMVLEQDDYLAAAEAFLQELPVARVRHSRFR